MQRESSYLHCHVNRFSGRQAKRIDMENLDSEVGSLRRCITTYALEHGSLTPASACLCSTNILSSLSERDGFLRRYPSRRGHRQSYRRVASCWECCVGFLDGMLEECRALSQRFEQIGRRVIFRRARIADCWTEHSRGDGSRWEGATTRPLRKRKIGGR